MLKVQDLIKKRHRIEKFRLDSSLSAHHADQMQQIILSSWSRSQSANIPLERQAAPLVKLDQRSTGVLQRVLLQCQNELSHIAQQSNMVVAVADMSSTILWTAASRKMQSIAESVHFVQGGQWCEEFVGTNALALSLKTQQSTCVFSNEHYLASVQDWVCYAAPIIDPLSQQILGVVDLSTTWKNHNSLGLLAAERCAAILQQHVLHHHQSALYIRALTQPTIFLNAQALDVTPRQFEILCILALCPQGLNLENLHHALYGERPVSIGTLKTEMSRLKDLLGHVLSSRPYQFSIEVEADFIQIEKALDTGCIEVALKLYQGVFLVKTESPFLCAWRDCFESRLSEAILANHDQDMLLKHLSRFPDAVDVLERLIELIPTAHPVYQHLMKYQ